MLLKSRFHRISDAVITANKATGAAGMRDGKPERSEMSHREESKSGLCDSQEGEQMCKMSLLSLLHLAFFFFLFLHFKKIGFSSPERCCCYTEDSETFWCLDSNPSSDRHTGDSSSISGVGSGSGSGILPAGRCHGERCLTVTWAIGRDM